LNELSFQMLCSIGTNQKAPIPDKELYGFVAKQLFTLICAPPVG